MLKRLLLTLGLLLIAGIAAAQGFKVADIQIEGNNRIETSTILAAVQIEPGDNVTLADVDAAVHGIFALGRFDDISAELTDVRGAKILTFVVTELPLVRDVLFSGNEELSEQKLRPVVTTKVPEIYSHMKVKESVFELENLYAEEGYHAALVEPEIEIDDQNEATLTFKITEGEKILIDEIRFIGNTAIEEDDLQDAMETRERWWLSWLTGRGAYQEEIMELDIERLKAAYKNQGYMDVKIKQPELALIDDNKYLEVVIEIDEGDQYTVGGLDFSGDLMKPEEDLLEYVSLTEGEIYDRSKMYASIERLTDLYADEGYANVNVAPLSSQNREDLTVDLRFDIDQGIKVYIERIQVRGNTRTRDKVVRREIPIVEGDQYSASKIKEGNRRVRNLGYFEEVNVTTEPGSSEDKTVLNVDVKEQPTGTFSIGVGYSSVDQFISQGSITQDNFLGYGLKLRLSGALSGSSQTFSLGVTDPYFLDTDWTMGFEVYKSEREYDDYDEYRTGGSLTAGHDIAEYTKGFVTYRYEESEILNLSPAVTNPIILEAVGTSTHSSISGKIVRNSTDYHLDPSTGGISEFTLQYAGLGGTENFLKSIVEHRHFWPLFWGTVFSIHGETGWVVETANDGLPLSERFFLGGIRNMRGFKSRELGPRYPDGTYSGGETMGYFNFEYLFPIAKNLGVKGLFFYDIGNVWEDSGDYFSDLRHSAGAGVRWNSPLGPLRFEWGYNLSPEDQEKQSIFEFSIGTAF